MARRSRSYKKRIGYILNHSKAVFLFLVGSAFLSVSFLILWASFIKLPDFNEFHSRKVVESTKIYDRTGKILLYDVHQNIKRTIVPFEAIPQVLKDATIAVEDSTFYSHYGIDPKSIIRAIIANITGGGFRQGGSTITQQVVKKTLLTDEKLLTRKLKEVILAFRLEASFSKEEILALYLNEVPYGGNIYGAGEASKVFFGKDVRDLSLSESAYLAALPNAPTYYSPYGNHRDELEERKNFVLKRMSDLSFITVEEYSIAESTHATFIPKEPTGIKAPHFVEWVKEYLVNKYGETSVEENGYKVITTLDYDLQKKAEEAITQFSKKLEEEYGAKNMALVAINPKNGEVLAMVGSRDYFDVKNEGMFNVAIESNRQPGSTFKPFAYATAFMKGYTPETVLFDLPTNFSTDCDTKGKPLTPATKEEDCYMPENYEGGYRGPLSMRSSLAQSRNITSVKTLYLAGIDDTITTAQRMGITSLNDRSRYGLSLVLGGGEVSLLDMTSAYGVFANDGIRNKTTSILRIEDKKGVTIEEFEDSSEEIIPSEVARKINNILSSNDARSPTFGANSSLHFPGKDVAVKTGTTNDYRDVWTVGYTPNIVVGMWGGNNDNTSIKKGNSAAYTISIVWHDYMLEAMKRTPSERFIAPEKEDLTVLPAPLQGIWNGGEKYIIDKSSGKLATPATPIEMKSTIVVPEVHTILHWVNKNNPRVLPSVAQQNDLQYILWETPIREWVTTQGIIEGDRSSIPSEYDDSRTGDSIPVVSLSGVDFNSVQKSTKNLNIYATVSSKNPVSSIELFINGQSIGKKTSEPYVFSFIPDKINSISTNNIITVIVYDSILNKGISTAQLIIE